MAFVPDPSIGRAGMQMGSMAAPAANIASTGGQAIGSGAAATGAGLAGTLGSAGILAGASLLKGLFDAQAKAKERKFQQAQRQAELLQGQGFQGQMGAQETLTQNQAQAFRNMMDGFGKALV